MQRVSIRLDNDKKPSDTLVGRARNSNSMFVIAYYSVKSPLEENWREKVRKNICMPDLTVIICGENTGKVKEYDGRVDSCLRRTKAVFLLRSRPRIDCKKLAMAVTADMVYDWTLENLKLLISGAR